MSNRILCVLQETSRFFHIKNLIARQSYHLLFYRWEIKASKGSLAQDKAEPGL